MEHDTRILIVGAGPVGLTLACLLAASGTPFRLIDAKSGTVQESRALGVHARTLELMQTLGLARDFVRHGRATRYMTFHHRDRPLFSLDFDVLRRDTAYPFYLILPQSVTEALLYAKLRELGGEVEWDTPLRSLEEKDDHVAAHFDGVSLSYPQVVGCDGASSVVRKSLGIGFSGFTYDARFVLSEVRIAQDCLPTDATHVILGQDAILAAIPLPNGAYRLVGPDKFASHDLESGAGISFDAFAGFLNRNRLLPQAGFHDASRVVSYRMQKRVADRFMAGGRVFLAGDAAHIHSPAGGQGMNMGMQDAANLAWRLTTGIAPAAYETERRAVALAVAEGTDKALKLMSAPGLLHRLAWRWIAPWLTRVWQPHGLIHAMTQLGIGYGVSGGAVGGLAVGRRLPWFRLADGRDGFDLLHPGRFTRLSFAGPRLNHPLVQDILVADNRYFRPAPDDPLATVAATADQIARLGPIAAVLVRPDGYIAAVDASAHATDIAACLDGAGR